jgi:hypothetical protein
MNPHLKTYKLVAARPDIDDIINGIPIVIVKTHYVTALSLKDAMGQPELKHDFKSATNIYGEECEPAANVDVDPITVPYLQWNDWLYANVLTGSSIQLKLMFQAQETMDMFFERTMVIDEYTRRPDYQGVLDCLELYGHDVLVRDIDPELLVTRKALADFNECSFEEISEAFATERVQDLMTRLRYVIGSQELDKDLTVDQLRGLIWEIGRKRWQEINKGETMEQIHHRSFVAKMSRRGQMKRPIFHNLLKDMESIFCRTGLDGQHRADADKLLVAGVINFLDITEDEYFEQSLDQIRSRIWATATARNLTELTQTPQSEQ